MITVGSQRMARALPAWFRIVNNPRLSVGPTIPFILGAIRDPLGKPPPSRAQGQRELHTLLSEMTEAGHAVRIQRCPGTQAHVAAKGGPGPSLTWEQALNARNTDALAGALWQLYGDHIEQGHYSKDDKWHSFSEDELEQIRLILSRSD